MRPHREHDERHQNLEGSGARSTIRTQQSGSDMMYPIINERNTMKPPYSFFRKEIVSKMMSYGIDEEEGEQSKMREYLFEKYKKSIYLLRKRLVQERMMLIKFESKIVR